MFLLLHLIAEEGVDEESFTLDTNSKNFQRGDDGREDLTTSCGSVLKPFYVYDINYPKPFAPIQEFLQHKEEEEEEGGGEGGGGEGGGEGEEKKRKKKKEKKRKKENDDDVILV
ncbi:hypothetical protein G5714_002971 [Onychostoma macrolepis]|uniref:Uncharacterized protein n=1 Tax=Onychostoma macrolepis TaxID=369639 RepID=A0A7J6D8J4_9TELE|nr:hypothetical protein G5714_002971 [Onychostoma macrolepis]